MISRQTRGFRGFADFRGKVIPASRSSGFHHYVASFVRTGIFTTVVQAGDSE
jgi:hypothetical protein